MKSKDVIQNKMNMKSHFQQRSEQRVRSSRPFETSTSQGLPDHKGNLIPEGFHVTLT